jgi:hypothetical protein
MGRARRYSDLDLAIDAGRLLTPDEMAELSEALIDSNLPYKVDFADRQSMDDHWRQMLAAEQDVLQNSRGLAARQPGVP